MVNTFANYRIMLNRTGSNILFVLLGNLQSKKIICGIHCFTISMCDAVVSQASLMMVEMKNYHSLKELAQLEHLNAKSAAFNKVTIKYKK